MPEVSVIIPAYNAEKTLRECLDSLLAQDYENYEIIVVDDGSTDNTKGVAESYGSDKIRCVRQPNGGVSAARNAGISLARGEYVIFCDADDCVSTRYVRTLMEHADGDALVICAMTTTRDALDTEDTEIKFVKFDYLRSPEFLTQLLRKHYIEGSWCKLFKKRVIQQHNLQFDRSMCFLEDGKFCYEYLQAVQKILYVNQFLYFYNSKNSVLTKSVNEWRIRSFLAYAEFISESFQQGALTGTLVEEFYDECFVDNYGILSLWSYAFLPYSQAHALQTKMRSHPVISESIKNCPWKTMNNYPGMQLKVRVLSRLNNGVVWRLLGTLKQWQYFLKSRFR